MFTTPREMPTLFTSKILEAVVQALAEDKPSQSLREQEFTSFLFPADLEAWTDASSSFSIGRFSPDCASEQFNEALPKLPDSLFTTEFEAWSRLARSLHSASLTGFALWRDS